MSLVFEWDPRKARANFLRHSVTFAEAISVFTDPLARIFEDEAHSADELREIIIGHSRVGRLLLVCFTERDKNRVRVISARRTTSKEAYDYREHSKN